MNKKPEQRPPEPKKFIGIYFRCCNLYARIYKNKEGTAYEGRCPGCGGLARALIGKDGVSDRFFEAV